MSSSADLYACIYAREFPAQALLRLRPELQHKPCVVMEGEAPLKQICSLNKKARLLGVKHGMTPAEAELFDDLVVLSRSAKTEAAAKAILLECAGTYSPRVEDRSEGTSFLCAVDIAGTETLFGSPETLAQKMLQHIKALGFSGCIILSRNLHAAVCLAKAPSQTNSIEVVSAGDEAAALAPLPLQVLSLTEAQAELFSLWGIRNLGMLAALPEEQLIARIGQEGKRLQQLARGEMPHFFQPVEPPFLLEERHELDFPLDSLDSLMFCVGVMLDQLILRARERIIALSSVTITLELETGSTHTRTVRPAQPTNEKQFWIKLLHLDLESHPPPAAILAATLEADPGSTRRVQLGLFSPQIPEASRLDVTLAHIRALVGDGNVGHPVLEDSHRPEAFHIEPFVVAETRSPAAPPSRPCAALRKIRPSESALITFEKKRPKSFSFRDRRFLVEHAYGPWTSSGDWWAPASWAQEQWDLVGRAQDGSVLCCCIVRDMGQQQWKISVLYD